MTAPTVIKDPQDRKEVTPRERWETEVEYAEKECRIFWDRGIAANRRFVDERDAIDAEAKKFNIFYANTSILESALYSQVPKPSVSRRYTDYRDQVGRVAALVLQRALGQDLNDPNDSFDTTMRQCVQDRLVPGLGTAWLRLETTTEDIPDSEGGSLTNDSVTPEPADHPDEAPPAEADPTSLDLAPVGVDIPLKKIKEQRVVVDYVFWKDFVWSPCRVWSERRWVARKTYLTKRQLETRFGKELAKDCSMDWNAKGPTTDRSLNGTTPTNEAVEKCVVYEIWDRIERKVIWYAPGNPKLLDTREDFLHLEGFEPVPMPMFANVSTSNTQPRPDYYMIQDQYNELDTVNARISLLVSACKVVGVYNKSSTGLIDMLQGAENKMIPVDNWAQFAEKNGVKGQVDWLPLEQIIQTLQRLNEAREAIKGQIYELTGIADIVRGASKASETLGAQQIKAQFASVRIKKLQDEVARFASDILRIKAEIMVGHFSVDMLIRKSGITRTDNDDYVVSAIATLKSEEGFQWRVTIQSDSMAQADYAMEKKDRIEFMSAVSGYMGNALPMTMQIPETKPIILGVLRWGMAAFKEADDIAGLLDKQIAEMEGKPPPAPPPDPKIAALQMKGQQDEKKSQMDMQKSQQEMAIKEKEANMEMAMKRFELTMQQQMNQMEMAMKKFELMMKQQEMGMKREEGQQNLQLKAAEGAQSLQQSQVEGQMNIEQSAQEHEQQMELSKEQGSQQLELGEAAGKQKLELEKKSAAVKNATMSKGAK